MTFMSVILFYRRDKTDIILVQRRNRRNGCNKTTLRLLEQNLQPSKKFYLENLLKGKKKKKKHVPERYSRLESWQQSNKDMK